MRHWFLTSTTYGTWLPGDERGSVTNVWDGTGDRELHNEFGDPCEPPMSGLRASAANSLRFDPVYFTSEQAIAVADQFRETATYRGWTIHGLAVLANHFHMLVEVAGDPDPKKKVLADFKAYATRTLNRRFGRKDEWWTGRGSARKKSDANAILAALAYIRDQPNVLLVWLNPQSIWVPKLTEYENGERSSRRPL